MMLSLREEKLETIAPYRRRFLLVSRESVRLISSSRFVHLPPFIQSSEGSLGLLYNPLFVLIARICEAINRFNRSHKRSKHSCCIHCTYPTIGRTLEIPCIKFEIVD